MCIFQIAKSIRMCSDQQLMVIEMWTLTCKSCSIVQFENENTRVDRFRNSPHTFTMYAHCSKHANERTYCHTYICARCKYTKYTRTLGELTEFQSNRSWERRISELVYNRAATSTSIEYSICSSSVFEWFGTKTYSYSGHTGWVSHSTTSFLF